MTVRRHVLYNSLSKSLKYDLWRLGAISFTIPYRNHWNMTCNSKVTFAWQVLIKIIEIWPMTARSHFLYNSSFKSLKYDIWVLGATPSQFLIKIIEIWPMTAMGHFLYNSLSKSLKYDLWLWWAISFRIPYQSHWNITYEC